MREGLLPHTVTAVLRLTTSEAKARAMTELLGEMLDPTETAVAAFEEEQPGQAPRWFVEVYFADAPDEEAILDLIRPIMGMDASSAVFSAVEAKDWVKSSLDGLKPVRAGRFLVHGSHDRDVAKVNDIAIEIEAGLAFGTGHHGTTAGCLIEIDRILRTRRPMRALDVGTGSGSSPSRWRGRRSGSSLRAISTRWRSRWRRTMPGSTGQRRECGFMWGQASVTPAQTGCAGSIWWSPTSWRGH